MTRKEELIACFNEAIEKGANHVWVEIFMVNFPSSEVIVNPKDNIELKLAYYEQTYDDNLVHNYSEGIGIVNFGYELDEAITFSYEKHEGGLN